MEYGAVLFRMVMMLAAVCAFALVTLRWGLRRFVAPRTANGPVEVVSRTVVEPRRAILVVRVGARHLVVGSSEAGMNLLTELEAGELAVAETTAQEHESTLASAPPTAWDGTPSRSFRALLLGARPAAASKPSPDEVN